jgi:uncharacterized protein (DUF924 family)
MSNTQPMIQQHNTQDVLDLWFPNNGHWQTPETHIAFWTERMQGGMDAIICEKFAELTDAAARGCLDHWAETPRGRLALLIALDQFSRSLWRDTPAAFSQDIKACRLCLEGIGNNHYAALDNMWEQQFYVIAISHCEGPDHLARMDLCIRLTDEAITTLPPEIVGMGPMAAEQGHRVRANIERVGRHPHRNEVLGRPSTPDEKTYIETGDFPHQRKIEAGS